jgi:predicted alpha/beta hydrolase
MLVALAVSLWLVQPAAAESVTIETPDGARLAARLFDAGRTTPGVVFFPMCSQGAADGWVPVAERLRRAGVSSLVVTYRGAPGNTRGSATGDQRAADAEAHVAFLRAKIGREAPMAYAGSSCGVYHAMQAAAATGPSARAAVLLSGPHTAQQLAYVRATPSLAVFSGASAGEPPSPEWARELKVASGHPASRVAILEKRAHGTALFELYPELAADIADWLVAQLRTASPAPAR